ncbi:hypothetical protein C0J29_32130 (plasmid) [Mycobacterium paragordonae]|uniref:ParB/Sulfiredoxin domain-containing protein n=1 Tax=Mycobacterium paragordonae TaxID=1389713 RepID=A0ABQ1CFF3_9MYCO|nr:MULTISPECIES: DUF6551 family protein [Mycobacterium]AYE99607.1 hypothetical protein C0J29_32130 [Mycobacterium paragordonae]QNI09730.1 hypothetical protein GAN17_25360 [Mycobacterium kubicae]QNI15259.1 hypothetical protein GAN18_29200 [Mycobacterium kubicae]GFG83164.1 hypothetical protein MPRG_64400 [Mycobacterium paragordonae]
MNGSSAAGLGGYVSVLHAQELFVDDSYQRPVDVARVRRMAEQWDRKLAGVIEVSDRGLVEGARYAVIDGQHRWEAAKLCVPVPPLVASVHEGLSVAHEAVLFDRLNRERRRPSTWDHWRARKRAGDPAVVALEAVVAQHQLSIDCAPREGNVRCTATLEKLAALGGTELVAATLSLITDVWDTRLDAFDAPIVHGLGLVLHHLRGRVDIERLTDTLLGSVPIQLKTMAHELAVTTSGTAPVRVAIAIMVSYNRNRRVPGERILVSARSFGGGARNARSLPAESRSA